MAITFEGISTQTWEDDNTGTTVSVDFPTNVEGDFLLACIGLSNAGTNPSVGMAAETGWTKMAANTWLSATAGETDFYYRFAPAGGISNQVFDALATTGYVACGMVFKGVDPTTPIDVGPLYNNHTSGTDATETPPAYTTVTDGAWGIISLNRDAAPVTITFPSGYTDRIQSGQAGPGDGVINCIGTQEHASLGTQTPGAFTWTGNQENCSMSFALRPGVTEGITAVTPSEFDFDNADVDIVGLNFEATQVTGAVYLSDATTLAGGANEVEIDGAINTWADALINLDFTGMTQTEIDNLHTLGPGARYLIVVNDTGDEYFWPVTLHRPQGIEMVLSPNEAPTTATSRLTGFSGTFQGGRFEETAAQNPSTTNTNVADNGYRTDVWNIQLTPAAREEIYDFRVLYGGIVSGTITQTPQVTGSFSADHIAEPGIDDLVLAGQIPIVDQLFVREPGIDDLVLAGQAPTVFLEEYVTPAIDDLVLLGYAPSAEELFVRDPIEETLDLLGYAPSPEEAHATDVAEETLDLLGYAPTVDIDSGPGVYIVPYLELRLVTLKGLQFLGYAPTVAVTSGIQRDPAVEELDLLGYAPTITVDHIVQPAAETLALLGYAPLSNETHVKDVAARALVLAGQEPIVGELRVALPAAEELDFLGYAPSLFHEDTISVPAETLSLLGYAPSAERDYFIDVAEETLDLAGYAPTLGYGTAVPEEDLTLTGYAPSAEQLFVRAPTVGALSITGYNPELAAANTYIPPADTLVLAGQAPSLTYSYTVYPSEETLSLAGYAPSVEFSYTASPDIDDLVLAGQAPSLTYSWTVYPAIDDLVLTGYVPTVLTSAGTAVPAGSLVLAGQAPSAEEEHNVDVPVMGSTNLFGISNADADDIFGANNGVVNGSGISGFSKSIRFPGSPASTNYFYHLGIDTDPIIAGRDYTLSCYVEMDDNSEPVPGINTSNGDMIANVGGAVSNPDATGTELISGTTWRIWWTTDANINSGQVGLLQYPGQSGKAFEASGFMIEDVTGRDDKTPSRYIETTGAANTISAWLDGYAPTVVQDTNTYVYPPGVRINRVEQSDDLDTSPWSVANATITDETGSVDPPNVPGITKTWYFKTTAAVAQHELQLSGFLGTDPTGETDESMSMYFKAGPTYDKMMFQIPADGNHQRLGYDITNGVQFGQNSGSYDRHRAIDVGDGWFRIAATSNSRGVGLAQDYFDVIVDDDTPGNSGIFSGDGTGIYVAGGQFETYPFETPYIASGATPGEGDIVTLRGYAPTLGSGTVISPAAATLSLAGQAPELKYDWVITPNIDGLVLSVFAPDAVDALTTKIQIPEINLRLSTDAGLHLTGYAPSVNPAFMPSPAAATLTLTGYVTQSDPVVEPAHAERELFTAAPIINILPPINVFPPVGAVTFNGQLVARGRGLLLTTHAPEALFSTPMPDREQLTLTTHTPSIVDTTTPPIIVPETRRELSRNYVAWVVTQVPQVDSLILEGWPAGIYNSSPVFLPPVAELEFTRYAVITDHVVVVPHADYVATITDDFNRASGFDVGPQWIQNEQDFGRPVIYDDRYMGSDVWIDGFYTQWFDVHHATPIPGNQFVEITFTDYRRADPDDWVGPYIWLRSEFDNGMYCYVYEDPDGSGTWFDWGAWHSPGDTNAALAKVYLPGGIPEGLKVRCEVIGTTYYTYYDIGDGWVEAVPPFENTAFQSNRLVGIGVEDLSVDSTVGIDQFDAGLIPHSLQTTTYVHTVGVTDERLAQPNHRGFNINTYAPSIFSEPAVFPAAADLTLTGQQPAASNVISVPECELVLTGWFFPVIEGFSFVIESATETLSLAGQAPVANVGPNITVPEATLSLPSGANNSVSVLDDFNRTGPGLGPDWQSPGVVSGGSTWPYGFELVSDEIRVDTVGQYAFARYFGPGLVSTFDQFAEVTLHGLSTYGGYIEASISLRDNTVPVQVDPRNQIYLSLYTWDTGNPATNGVWAWIDKQVEGSWTNLLDSDTGLNADDITDGTLWRCEVQGPHIRMYLGSTLIAQLYDTDVDGSVGTESIPIQLLVSDTADDLRFDNFRAGTMPYTAPITDELHVRSPDAAALTITGNSSTLNVGIPVPVPTGALTLTTTTSNLKTKRVRRYGARKRLCSYTVNRRLEHLYK